MLSSFLISSGFGLPETVALAVVAALGYLFGRRQQRETAENASPAEVLRAAEIARQLEAIAAVLRKDLAIHQADVDRFKVALRKAGSDDSLDQLRTEADRVLEPTLRLVGRLAKAYDQIRRQSRELSDFSGGRCDPQTGVANRRALGELLQVELAGCTAAGGQVSVVVFGLAEDPSVSPTELEAGMHLAAELLRGELRDADLIARFGVSELVVVMPHTRLYGATVFARRARMLIAEAGIETSCGLSQSAPGDEEATLLARADSALYSAKAAGGGLFLNNGRAIRSDTPRVEVGRTSQEEHERQGAEVVVVD